MTTLSERLREEADDLWSAADSLDLNRTAKLLREAADALDSHKALRTDRDEWVTVARLAEDEVEALRQEVVRQSADRDKWKHAFETANVRAGHLQDAVVQAAREIRSHEKRIVNLQNQLLEVDNFKLRS